MKIGGSHLTYCTNIHAGESWAEVEANLVQHVTAVKARVAPDLPFGVGLRLGARAAAEVDPRALRKWLDAHGMYVFTINGFPYGTFHGTVVKDGVYRPDWREPERVAYTNRLADILEVLLPDGMTGSISTVPGCFRARGDVDASIVDNLASCVDYLAGRRCVLALEPEPACAIETLAEARALVAQVPGLALCIDACHAAVEFEDLADLAGLPIAKLQLSAGLVCHGDPAPLAAFCDDVYLHQVVGRRGDTLVRYTDLPDALADRDGADEWRVHFHVPIFRADGSTQAFLAELLAHHRAAPIAPHLEVETYTWDVLPIEYRDEPIADAIARELRWVMERL